MFLIDKNSNITLTRGETACVKLKLFDKMGLPVNVNKYDRIIFCVAKNPDRVDALEDPIIYKEYESNCGGYITVESADTIDVKLGEYFYDVKVIRDNSTYDSQGQIVKALTSEYTVIPIRKFVITPDIARVPRG